MLTDLAIRTLPLPSSGLKRYRDRDGLCLQVSQGGAKTFYLVHGADRRFLKLGRYPIVTLSQARDRVRDILAKKQLGIADETSPEKLGNAIDRYLETYCVHKQKPKTISETCRPIGNLWPLADRRVSTLQTREIMSRIEQSSASISKQRHVFAVCRGFFNWCCRDHIIKHSPLEHQKAPGKPGVRTRTLSDDEMARIYKAALEMGVPYGTMCTIAIRTGMRRGEVGALEWSYLTPQTIALPATLTKNSRHHVIPNLIQANIDHLPRTSKYIFPSSAGTPYSTWSDGKEELHLRPVSKTSSFTTSDDISRRRWPSCVFRSTLLKRCSIM